ncbi:unnamed protein product [Fraxinus pennsylvanica]|uniref:Condensin complex subunit 2 n=1 Tax=Fraxinus pennsylvanica TaxID=56036 RepID=A0AAD1YNG8_9LAMI|nr:unnamed protein product [Fraxinus pennsylvanica]
MCILKYARFLQVSIKVSIDFSGFHFAQHNCCFVWASCTLEAGVKIYSMRVDSVHSEAYKVLGGINRVGQEDEQDNVMENANIDNEHDEGHSKKQQERKLSPLSTLESSFEALNVKKFDDSEDPAKDNGLPKTKKAKNRKAESDIELSNALDTDASDIFAPPKNPKSLFLPTNRAPCNTKLPEDCHYQPENLVKLFLLPHVTCIRRRGSKTTGEDFFYESILSNHINWTLGCSNI